MHYWCHYEASYFCSWASSALWRAHHIFMLDAYYCRDIIIRIHSPSLYYLLLQMGDSRCCELTFWIHSSNMLLQLEFGMVSFKRRNSTQRNQIYSQIPFIKSQFKSLFQRFLNNLPYCLSFGDHNLDSWN